MGRELEESFKKTFNPEQLEKLKRDVEESVRKQLDSGQLEETSKKIAELKERRAMEEKGRAAMEKAKKAEKEAKLKEKPGSADSDGSKIAKKPTAKGRTAPDRSSQELDGRLRSMEQRLEMLTRELKNLERSEKP
jgi:hypothetical protein